MLRTTKKTCLPDHRHILTLAFLLALFGSACNTRIEGCLEVNAENFDLNAELPCDGCCTYPSLGLTLSQKWNERNFANTDTLYDQQGQAYQISDLHYFLTTWSWRNAGGDLFTVDSIEGDCDEDILRFTPDNLVIDTRQFTYTLGNTRDAPLTDTVNCALGLTRDFSCLDPLDPDVPEDLTDQSVLWNKENSKLETMRLILRKDIASEALDTLYIDISASHSMPYSFEFKKGFDMQFLLTVNYALWFADVIRGDLSSFEASIQNHFRESLFPTP